MTAIEHPQQRRWGRWFTAIVTAAIMLQAAYVVLVRPGTPGDEPSHFQTVQYYADHLRMPVLGQPGVGYEGQMGPVYYAVAAVVYRPVSFVAGERFAFFALRALDGVLIVPMLFLTRRIATRLLPDRPGLVVMVVLFTAFNPSLMAIGASVQNDMLTVVLSLWATDMALRWFTSDRLSPARGTALGCLVSLAILTKSSAIYLVPSIAAFALVARGPGRLKFTVAFGVVVAACTMWWFVRNRMLYGDWTAQRGLRDHGYMNAPPPVSVHSLHEVGHWLWQIAAYYWFPTEYYRMIFRTPRLLQVVAAATMVAAVAGWASVIRQWHHQGRVGRVDVRPVAFLATLFTFSMSIYTISCFRFTFFAARTTFPTFVCYAIAVCVGLYFAASAFKINPTRVTLPVLAVLLLIANALILHRVALLPVYPFTLFP